MELDILKQNTTWNDASASINNNFAMVKTALEQGGGNGGGGLVLRELKMSGSAEDNAYNLETLELMEQGKVLPAFDIQGGVLTPLVYMGDREFYLRTLGHRMDAQMNWHMADDGSITQTAHSAEPPILQDANDVVEWRFANFVAVGGGSFLPAFIEYDGKTCSVLTYHYTTLGGEIGVEFTSGGKRYLRTYNDKGEEISTTEIPTGGNGGGSTAVDTELSLTSNNPVSNTVITSNIGIRVIEVDINSTEGWQQVFNTLISQSDNGAFIPVFCMLEGQPAYVYGVAALGLDGRTTSLAAICNGKTYVSPGGTKAMEYPFLFTDDLTKKTDNLLKTVLCNDSWNEAVLEIDGLRYRANEFKLEQGYVTFKVVIGNELRTYAIYRLDADGIEAGTLTLQNTEYIGSGGGGGSIDPEILEAYTPLVRDFSNDFNNDFTN